MKKTSNPIKAVILIHFICIVIAQTNGINYSDIKVGAEKTEAYLPFLKNKNVGIVANQSSRIGNTHIVDSLLSLNVRLIRIFCPEHGFRGNYADGEHISNNKDEQTGLPIISLYGASRKMNINDLDEIDIMIFDIQDVGVRFYTYISTMHWVMEACAEAGIELIILDRPNPNGFFIDGPILESADSSFVGMHPVPIVHGMTIAEYARMINGEGWLSNGKNCKLKTITCDRYTHKCFYKLPVKPSPNLPNMEAIFMYPSLGLFEGTAMSVGRGTDFPFQVIGSPEIEDTSFSFIPQSIPGVSVNPPYKGITCNGKDLRTSGVQIVLSGKKIHLQWIIDAYNAYPDKSKFFSKYFHNLAGNKTLKKQIIDGMDEESIRDTWKNGLFDFKMIRRKYLLYEDFE